MGTDIHHYRSLGLTIRSEIPLPGLRRVPEGPSDLTVARTATQPVPVASPPGETILDFVKDGRRRYSAVMDRDGYLLRFSGVCEVRLSPDLKRAQVTSDPTVDPGLPQVILAGTVLAFVMQLAGQCVLHASAVEVDGRALAFVGHSGMGKSTLTIAACVAGARLVAEDVLVVDTGNPPTCLPGNVDVRLRRAAEPLLDQAAGWRRIATPDGRLGVRPPTTSLDRVPLDTIVVPRPSRRLERLETEVIEPSSAVFRLVNFPRVLGFTYPPVVEQQFRGLAAVAARVPVVIARIPWGPPFPPDMGRVLIGMMQSEDQPARHPS